MCRTLTISIRIIKVLNPKTTANKFELSFSCMHTCFISCRKQLHWSIYKISINQWISHARSFELKLDCVKIHFDRIGSQREFRDNRPIELVDGIKTANDILPLQFTLLLK